MSALGLLGLAPLAALLALLVVPFRARALASVHGASPRGELRIDWGWGFLGFEVARGGAALRLLGLKVWSFGPRTPGEPKAEEKKERGGAIAALRAGFRHRRPLFAIASRLALSLHLRLVVRGVVGAGDPADTALLFAALRALEELPGVELDLRPEWLDEELEVDVRGGARIVVAELLVAVVGLLLVPKNRAAVREMRAAA